MKFLGKQMLVFKRSLADISLLYFQKLQKIRFPLNSIFFQSECLNPDLVQVLGRKLH